LARLTYIWRWASLSGAVDSKRVRPVAPLRNQSGWHVLHYASTCFEGFKAFTREGSVHIFVDRNSRMRQSAGMLLTNGSSQIADIGARRDRKCRDVGDGNAPGAAVPAAISSVRCKSVRRGPTAERCYDNPPPPKKTDREPVCGRIFPAATKALRILVDGRKHACGRARGMSRPAEITRRLGALLECEGKIPGIRSLFCPGGQRPGDGASTLC